VALLVHSGTAAVDLSASQTFRDDISDVLMASLVVEPNLMGIVDIAEEFSAEQATWNEDSLNPYKFTALNSFATLASSTSYQTGSFTVSQADAAVLDVGYVFANDAGVGQPHTTSSLDEQFQVITLNGQTVTANRNFGGASTLTFTSQTTGVMRIINRPTYPNSDLGKDLTRARIAKNNFINRFELNVNIDSEQIARTRQGYVPGVRDELGYQFQQRLVELKRVMGNAFIYSKAPNVYAGTSPNIDYQTFWGLLSWLDGTANTTAAPTTTAQTLSDSVINTGVLAVYRQGADSNIIAVGPSMAQRIGQLYTDRMRLDQSDTERGFFAQSFIPSMANRHYLINDLYISDGSIGFPAGTAVTNAFMFILDMSRIRIKPYVGQFFYTVTSPSFRDGDAVRCLSKWTIEVRNTGSDAGFAHQLVQNLS
jgi:Family of unknown function (DUF5309)